MLVPEQQAVSVRHITCYPDGGIKQVTNIDVPIAVVAGILTVITAIVAAVVSSRNQPQQPANFLATEYHGIYK